GTTVINGYGPTENTTFTTCHPMRSPGEVETPVSIGAPIANTRVHLLDWGFEPVPVGVPGELFAGGDGVALGYRGRPDLTAERFVPDPFAVEAGARLYRTGDLARWDPSGKIGFLGRADRQVKIRGFRIEPAEIEAALALHPEVGEAAVVVRDDLPGGRALVACAVPREGDELPQDLQGFLRERLPDYMVPAFFVALPALPLTANGKVDRAALARLGPVPGGGERETVLPRNPLEERLAGIWSEVLGVATVGVHDNFFELGGHSLLAVQVISRVSDALGVDLPLAGLFEEPTVAGLASRLAGALAERLAGLPAAPLPETAPASGPPLSFAQHRLWLTDLLEPGGTAYNLSVAARLAGTLDLLPLARSLAEILSRHEPLRTVFPQVGGEPVQVVLPPPPAAALPLARVDLAGVAPELRDEALRAVLRAEAERPFDLAHGPVARFLLVRLAPREHVLVASFHHIAADGWSMGVFFEELAALYSGSPLPELPFSYAGFALWQRREAEGEAVQRQLAWWRQELAGLPVLELPTDRPRAAARSHRGANRQVALSAELAARLRALAPAEGITLFVTLLGGFAAVLSRWSGQGDVPVGVPSAGRNRVETERMIGFFVNTLVLRGRMEDDPPFLALLRRLRRTAVAAQANQDVPFDRLVEELHPHRDPGVSPLFQVMFAFLAVPPVAVRMPGLEASLLEVETRTAKFDLTLSLHERDGELSGFLEYRTELFEAATADRLLGHLATLLAGAAADPDLRLSELPLLSEAERGQLLAWSAGTVLDFPDVRLHELFLARAAEAPAAPAVVFEGGRTTYGELRDQVERLSRRLRRDGVGPERVVGLCTGRSPGFVAGVLAVWNAGGAYLPLDPTYPADRLALMLEDSGAAVVLAEERHLPALPAGVRVVLLEGEDPEGGEAPAPIRPEADGLAAVLYTSGSTGRPKGVMLHHRGLANRLLWAQETYGLTAEDAFLLKAPFSFDVSIWETLAPLIAGARVVIPPPGGERDVSSLARVIAEERVTIAHFVPSMLAVFLREEGIERLTSLRQVFSGGEALTPGLRDLFFSRLSASLDNEYGPTEITVDVTRWACAPGEDPWRVPLGRPIANTRIHLLDRGLRPVAAGLSGRLHVGGPGVARGYLGRPDLTAERFVPDPW
ncbi:MAG TPA: amino acid adenylation domain-containing protein, partial [Thermoanaerobaculia bacterium]|nr:amino acid adenylation domain-containing protein [Thermoanaerobaculia bacterium]